MEFLTPPPVRRLDPEHRRRPAREARAAPSPRQRQRQRPARRRSAFATAPHGSARRSSRSARMEIDDALGRLRRQSRRSKSVSLPVRQGEVLALIGPSGCGKTTLLRSLNRLTELTRTASLSRPDHARRDRHHRDRADRAAAPGDDGLPAAEPVPDERLRQHRLRPARAGLAPARARSTLAPPVHEALDRAGLFEEVKDNLDHPALKLSGGQQQRLCIARALAAEPEVLLLDEPCSALDPQSTQVIEDLIVKLRDDVAVVIVTHNLQQAYRVADYVGFMYLGDLVEYGGATTLFGAPARAADPGVRQRCLRLAPGRPIARRRVCAALAGLAACADDPGRRGPDRVCATSACWPAAHPVQVRRADPRVKVLRSAVVRDGKRTAVVVALRNTGRRPLNDLPRSPSASPRLRPAGAPDRPAPWTTSRRHAPALAPGATTTWVFTTADKGTRCAPCQRQGRRRAPARPPRPPRCPTWRSQQGRAGRARSKLAVEVDNDTGVPQYDLDVYAWASRGGRYVAAGRASVLHIGTGETEKVDLNLSRRPARRDRARLRSPDHLPVRSQTMNQARADSRASGAGRGRTGEYEKCQECGAPLDRQQRYCVNCAARRSDIANPSSQYFASASRRRRQATRPAGAAAQPRTSRAAAVGFFALLPVAVAIGVLVGRSGNGSSDQALLDALRRQDAAIAASGGAGTAATGGGSGALASTAESGPVTSDFKLKKGYTVKIGTLPGDGRRGRRREGEKGGRGEGRQGRRDHQSPPTSPSPRRRRAGATSSTRASSRRRPTPSRRWQAEGQIQGRRGALGQVHRGERARPSSRRPATATSTRSRTSSPRRRRSRGHPDRQPDRPEGRQELPEVPADAARRDLGRRRPRQRPTAAGRPAAMRSPRRS